MSSSFFRICAPLNHEPEPGLLRIEVASSLQIPAFQIVGLVAREVDEARERVRAAIEASGQEFPRRRVVLNLSPANVRKHGTGLDLAMALAVLASERPPGRACLAWGELGLDGRIKPTGCVLRSLATALEERLERVVLAREEEAVARSAARLLRDARPEAGWPGPRVHFAATLAEAWQALDGRGDDPAPTLGELATGAPRHAPAARAGDPLLPIAPRLARILGTAAAGSHHLLLLGPRGAGKSHALEWLSALVPGLDPRARLARELLAELGGARPADAGFRRVGQYANAAALIGGATAAGIRPGEFALAHGGLLVADELPEWPRDAREALREPLERGRVTLTRVNGSVELPARFTLAGTGNLCPCGGWPGPLPRPEELTGPPPSCGCGPRERDLYGRRLSGPVLDRVDLVVTVTGTPPVSDEPAEALLRSLAERVREARARLIDRYGALPGELPADRLEELLSKQVAAKGPGETGSLRSRHKAARVALSLAAWDRVERPGIEHWREGLLYRPEASLCTSK